METLSYPTEIRAYKSHVCNFCYLMIEKGSKYLKSSHKNEGDLYTWKSHIHCSKLLDKIGVLDFGDGVSGEDFQEYATSEYQNIMSEHFNDTYKSKDFKIPRFEDRLKIVLDFHKLQQ